MRRKAPDLISKNLGGADRITVGACRHVGDVHRTAILALIAALTLSGCNEENADGSLSSGNAGHSLTVSSFVRPKADPLMMQKIRDEEAEARRKEAEAVAAQLQQTQQQNAAVDPANRDLPAVDTSPIAEIASAFGFGNNNNQPTGSAQAGIPPAPVQQIPTPPPSMQSYGGGYPSPGGSMIPPPPAVSLYTQATPMQSQDPYAQAYAQGGYNPYQQQQQYQQPQYQQPPIPSPSHPTGSMFSNGGANSNSSSSEEPPKRQPAMVVITPTGMDQRSQYKQRDDLKLLVKGAFAATSSPELKDGKLAVILSRTDVGLPAEATKGNISLGQRQIDNLFKTPPVDKKVLPLVKKLETDVAQSYYRYLYSFNKYTLNQQQVAARKQEMDVSDTPSEKQRAAADLSAAQNDAEASKDDLRAAQSDMASVAGVQAARSVITKVSGVSPSIESLAVADQDASQNPADGIMGSVGNALGALNFWNKGKPKPADSSEKVAAEPVEKPKSAKPKGKDKKAGKERPAPAPQVSSTESETPEETPPAAAAAPKGSSSTGISFELKNVQTTPRKSVLKVAVRNNGENNFTLDPEIISVLEGDRKLAEAAVRAEFDSTLVGPNQEVTGTITIFGRPWNDKLSVSLSEGGRTIQLHR